MAPRTNLGCPHEGPRVEDYPSRAVTLPNIGVPHLIGVLTYRATSLIRSPPPVGPYSSPMPRDLTYVEIPSACTSTGTGLPRP